MDEFGKTALDYALKLGNPEIINVLEKSGGKRGVDLKESELKVSLAEIDESELPELSGIHMKDHCFPK